MTGEVRIENLNIGNVYFFPGTAAEGALSPDAFSFLREQIKACAISVKGEDGYPIAEEDLIDPDDTSAPETPVETDQERADRYEAEESAKGETTKEGKVPRFKGELGIEASVEVTEEEVREELRSDSLHQLVAHADKANGMRGFNTGAEEYPHSPGKVATIKTQRTKKAKAILKLACANCDFNGEFEDEETCKLKEDFPRWLDIHPYKERNTARPGSLYGPERESRHRLLVAVRENSMAHCDPKVRRKIDEAKADEVEKAKIAAEKEQASQEEQLTLLK